MNKYYIAFKILGLTSVNTADRFYAEQQALNKLDKLIPDIESLLGCSVEYEITNSVKEDDNE